MTKLKSILLLTVLLLLFSCSNKKEITDEHTYILGVFYANNLLDAKDSTNHFQHNCNYLLMLKHGELEIYNRANGNTNQNEFSVAFTIEQAEMEKFKKIVITESKRKKLNTDHSAIYCGNTYITCLDSLDNSTFFISSHGIEKNDEKFIFELIKKGKTKRKINPSNKLRKEKYFMLGIMQKELYIPGPLDISDKIQ